MLCPRSSDPAPLRAPAAAGCVWALGFGIEAPCAVSSAGASCGGTEPALLKGAVGAASAAHGDAFLRASSETVDGF